jgi:2-keto-3-deoxy-L-rhamnonate aldolase RhmA
LQANYGLDVREGGRQVLVDHALRETFLFVQVETPQGLQNAAAMAAIPGVDGLYLGPSDLLLRMQYEPEAERRSYEDALDILASACHPQGKFWGAWPRNLDDIKRQHSMGAQLLQWGVDNEFVTQGLQANMATLNGLDAG